jgi:hypothetical protein
MSIQFVKQRVQLPLETVRKLKDISYLSSIKHWEYAGGINYNGFKFSEPTYATSKKRGRVEAKDVKNIWKSDVTYHTHPGYGKDVTFIDENYPIFTTLPSACDFEAYIKGFPRLQSNIICDAHGYYVIDVTQAAYNNTSPLPSAVNVYMLHVRGEPFMRIHAFSDEGFEYFHTTLKNWKRYINSYVHENMLENFGISIRYYGYTDIPPTITFLKEVYRV